MKNKKLVLIIFYSAVGLLIGQYSGAHCVEANQASAIKITKSELKRLGYKTSGIKFIIDDNNTRWNEKIDKDKKLLSSVTLKRLNLSEKNYWAIYFHPKDENTLGGDGWFFVDKDS